MINANICVFTNLLLVFLRSIFDARGYDGSYLSWSYAPRPIKFIVESVEKNKSISSTHGGFKILP